MKIAVVGSGVSGLGATWLLNEYTGHEVHLFEADSRPGGHANTVTFDRPGMKPTGVDTSIVFNPSTYPNFINFLNQYPDLAERILPTEMTFAVSRDMGAFEWAGNNLMTVFCQPSRLLDLEMWRLIYDVVRFNASAQRLIVELESNKATDEELSIGTYLKQHRYSDSFRDNYLIPMTAAIWSTPPDKCALDFPARTLIQFMHNHHLLQITGKPKWLTLRGGSRTYVQKILSRLPSSRLHLSTPIQSVKSTRFSENAHIVELTTASGETMEFDHVILACHTDTTVDILNAGGGMTSEEARILEAFKWNRNEAVLHCDERLMPKSRLAWSCWNYLTKSVTDAAGKYLPNVNQVSLTYWMNDLQHLSMKDHGPVLVTLNPPFDPKPSLEFGRYKYDHPILSEEAIRAQDELPSIQRTRGISYSGAWTKYGFHEDGFTSGLRAAAALLQPQSPSSSPSNTAKLPFEIVPADRRPDRGAVWLARAFDAFEGSGAAYLLGTLFAFALAVLRAGAERLGLDLSHLEHGAKRLKRE
ncbi:FAD/NAD(P)-binding domain-containing protein [Lentinus tigrinus ALCF2SS1-7]|uniref:FAD/NAD(P)-binding domain-containing protein n=1 Tax=Lentinus tigrinus ALCF2SS1-6 TaxID=1328759 RepID=A0A5C2SFK5_9APHY|nr:FAD/NAD(P)-binding domain-containing protein [Lentinus tigrinus ALCF2SS1-6]RPD77715.1 FAD/NAD(P)-binding domain-containing protein [Lentinus tigrinus ALCF2SS1-7]